MDAPWRRQRGRPQVEPSGDLTADVLRFAASLVTLVAAILLGVVR